MLLAPEYPNDLLHFALMGLRALFVRSSNARGAEPQQRAERLSALRHQFPQSVSRPAPAGGKNETIINEGMNNKTTEMNIKYIIQIPTSTSYSSKHTPSFTFKYSAL